MKLREIAHSRTGDKGNISNISVIAYDAKDYALLLEQVTAARVKAHFAGIVQGEVVRYELPNLFALNFVMDQALGGGVTRSLALDAHGKSLSSALLDLDIATRAGQQIIKRVNQPSCPIRRHWPALAADLDSGRDLRPKAGRGVPRQDRRPRGRRPARLHSRRQGGRP